MKISMLAVLIMSALGALSTSICHAEVTDEDKIVLLKKNFRGQGYSWNIEHYQYGMLKMCKQKADGRGNVQIIGKASCFSYLDQSEYFDTRSLICHAICAYSKK